MARVIPESIVRNSRIFHPERRSEWRVKKMSLKSKRGFPESNKGWRVARPPFVEMSGSGY